MLEMPRAAFIAALEDHPEDFVLEIVGMGHAVRCLHCFHASTSKTDESSWFMDYPFLRNLYQNDLVKPRSNATHLPCIHGDESLHRSRSISKRSDASMELWWPVPLLSQRSRPTSQPVGTQSPIFCGRAPDEQLHSMLEIGCSSYTQTNT